MILSGTAGAKKVNHSWHELQSSMKIYLQDKSFIVYGFLSVQVQLRLRIADLPPGKLASMLHCLPFSKYQLLLLSFKFGKEKIGIVFWIRK